MQVKEYKRFMVTLSIVSPSSSQHFSLIANSFEFHIGEKFLGRGAAAR